MYEMRLCPGHQFSDALPTGERQAMKKGGGTCVLTLSLSFIVEL
jgi:hypothetical protein